ncbi:hypothetical protein GQ53DRAFT_749476 [Thozetella sp. PMI_491]|nr:hypothetical protein GQ53DRAFT_749476 [Thozetella sp. PMI_491]
MVPVPGFILANSKISDDSLDADTFRTWYEEVHIPDVLATSGIFSSFRFQAPDSEPTRRPYLAVYPLSDLMWLANGEFFRVPLTSDLLPNPSKHISEVADFDIRFYQTILSLGDPESRAPTDSVVIVTFDSDATDTQELFRRGSLAGEQPIHSTLAQIFVNNSLPRSEFKVDSVPQYIVIHEFHELPFDSPSKEGNQVVKFKHLRAFGDQNSKWLPVSP